MKKLSGVLVCLLLFTFISSARIIEVADAGITDKFKAVIAAKNAAGGADVTAPTVDTVVIGTDGTTVTLTMSENTTVANQDEDEFNLDCDGASGANVAMTYSSGTGTTSLVFTTGATVIQSTETCNLDYSNAQADEFEDAAGNDLASPITDKAVTNNSEQGASYYDLLACDDNADNSTATNTGTRAANWFVRSASDYSSDIHSATASEGTGSFYLDDTTENIRNETFALENFELIFRARFDNATASGYELWFHIGDEDFDEEPNEMFLYRVASSDELHIEIKGNNAGATLKHKYTDNFAPDADTWYYIKLAVNATATTWTIALSWSTDGSSYTNATWDAGGDADWATGYTATWDTSTAWFGDSAGAYPPVGYVDYITFEDKS